MINHFGPYYGVDSFIDFLILIVAALVSFQSYRIYLLLKDKNYYYFSLAFFSIAASHVFKIFSNLTIQYKTIITDPNFVLVVVSQLENMRTINFLSFIFYKVFFVIGFLILFLIVSRSGTRENLILFGYLSLTTVVLSIYFNFIFYLTLLMLHTFLAMYFHKNYQEKKSRTSLLSYLGFVILLVSSFLGLFLQLSPIIYLADEILVLAAFLTLLLNHLTFKNEKKNKTGSNS